MKGPVFILAALLLFGCADHRSEEGSEKPVFFTSILPQAGLVRTIAGDHVEVVPLVGEGQSPHTYEPTARQLAKLARANAVLTIGVPFEASLLKKITSLYPDLPVVETQSGIVLRSMAHEHHGEECEHDHGAKDPHLWLSPANLKTMAGNICRALVQFDPGHVEDYQKNHDALVAELDRLDMEIRVALAPCKGSRIYVFHPSFGYFTDAYGLEQVPIELDGKSPSPRQLADLIEQAQVDGVRVVFVSRQFPMDSAKAVADAIGGVVVQLDPLAEDVVANLRQIAESIVQASEHP